MRSIHVEGGLRLRFPGRDGSFDEGVEIGLLAAGLASGRGEFTLKFGSSTLEQARSLATGMGYRVHVVRAEAGEVEVTFLTGRRRPKLTLISTQALANRAG